MSDNEVQAFLRMGGDGVAFSNEDARNIECVPGTWSRPRCKNTTKW